MKTRNELIDILKAIAIILLILGHSIQGGSGNEYLLNNLFFDNYLFKFIYSFHMPLFMLISGYLFYNSTIKYSWVHNIKSRITTLLIPIAAWSIISFTIRVIGENNFSVVYLIKTYIGLMINNLWFLWAILYCSVVVIIVKKFFRDSVYLYLFGFILSLMIPDILGSASYKFMYPFFIIGYFVNKNHDKLVEITKKVNSQMMWLIISGIPFFILLLFYNWNSYIYTTGYYIFKGNPLQQLVIDIYRMIIGLLGSMFVITLIKLIKQKLPNNCNKYMALIGKNSLGIYVMSGYLFEILKRITYNLSNINYGIMIAETIIIVTLSLLCTMIIKKVKVLNVLLLGGRA